MLVRRALFLAFAMLVLAACAASTSGASETTDSTAATTTNSQVDVSSTVGGVGVLPGPLPTQPIEVIASTTTIPVPVSPEQTVGALAAGNRVLMMGDSILASTSKRYGNNMCKALVPMGWEVAIEAEVSRDASFGNKVLDRMLDDGWDAGLVLLGNNYDGDAARYLKEMNEIINRFEGKPVVLLTVTEFKEDRRQVNDVIRSLAELYPNVIVVDWASMSRFSGVLATDGLHLTDGGREVLAQVVAPQFDVAPKQPGKCLDATFHDDSAGSVDGSGNSSGSGGGVTQSTTRPTATTVKPSGSSTTSPSSGGSSTTSPTGTTSPPTGTTQPPTGTTAPPTGSTSPPRTDPPSTPAPTSPPTAPPTQPTTPPTQPTQPPPTTAEGGP